MEFDVDTVREVSYTLASEDGQVSAPRDVVLAWLALTDGQTKAVWADYESGDEGSFWRVIGADDAAVYVLEARSEDRGWYLENSEVIPGSITRAVAMPISAFESMRLVANKNISGDRGSIYRLRSRWEVTIAGEVIPVPKGSLQTQDLYDRSDAFIAQLKAIFLR